MTELEIADGMATLGPRLVELRARLDELFVAWAAAAGAAAMSFPPLLRAGDLAGLDYFENFPHLAFASAPLRRDRIDGLALAGAALPATALADATHVLPSAACYPVYLHLRGRRLAAPVHVTTVATCHRNETEYRGLARLRAFTMREIVCVGGLADVEAHLAGSRERIADFAARLGLPLELHAASDPFYERQEARRRMQLLAPVKHEFVAAGGVAVASLNLHRNFFGERCAIAGPDGHAAFSGCVAFGLERWLHALGERFGDGAGEALARCFP